ncbi:MULTISPECIES: non-ribosomal peptide synthetase/MFS transporter [unclassified Streptomyces]|uniref:non-ribosomal peptide synthetase/MFS transporter n=1 Tax=unclassified Streptomyces TaxID=2593676 RepID=UPI001654D23F|nr:non-ribosomal peptide synthetase/MFS transporter [Streptomyces sp. CB02980]MCB8905462.1 amino acid adenylation domain-containing protein [Streptomyces sp. CB02980]
MTDTQDLPIGWSPAKRALLSRRLRGAASPARVVDPRPADTAPPLSSGQERLWFMDQFAPGSTAYTLAPARRLRGRLDRAALDAALTDLVARHESLRMTFRTTEAGTAEVEVAEPAPFAAQYLDARADPHPEARAAAALGAVIAEPFDLQTGPLLRALVVRIAEDDHVLALVMHHIISDGWSIDLLNRELDLRLAHHADGAPGELAPLEVQFGDYAAWQRDRLENGQLAASRAYWRTELDGVPALELPSDRPRPPLLTFDGAATEFRWSADLAHRIGEVARAYGASPYMVLMASFQALLGRHTGQRDFAVGSAAAGRLHRELENVVGAFVNMLPIRARLSADLEFGQLISRVRETTLDAYAHQEVPFEQMVNDLAVERDVSRAAVFQTTFAFQNYGDRTAVPAAGPAGLDSEGFGYEATTTHADLALYMREESDGGLYGLFTYRTDLFDADTVERIAERFELLTAAGVADPALPVDRIPMLGTAERTAVLETWAAGPPLPDGGPATLTQALARTAARTPDAPALVFEDRTLTYGDLDRRAGSLARRLRALGVGADDRVAVCLEQSPELAVALVAVLKAGGGYLPLDPEQPPARLAHLVTDAGAKVLITDTVLRARFGDHPAVDLLTDGGTDATEGDGAPLEEVSGADHLAYVIYTSGSTGTPKGVAVQHRQFLNYLAGAGERLRIEPGASFGLLQSLSFDFSMTMLYLALTTGGRVHLLPRRIAGVELAAEIERAGIDYLKMTPSHLAALTADAPIERLLPRRALVLGGEASSRSWAAGIAALGRCAVFNHYGPTEATVGITVHEVTADGLDAQGSTPIGSPLAGGRCYVLDEARNPVPPGVTGELYLGGDRLARGYLGRPDLTTERFLPDPYAGPAGAEPSAADPAGTDPSGTDRDATGTGGPRMYRTGDLARWRTDGTLDYLGRGDDQIKVRGYRVEPGEIEAALTALPGITQAVVLARGEGVRQNLVAYLERPAGGEPPAAAELRAALGEVLPDYMVPARYVLLERLPLLAHGKVDRKALPAPADGPATGAQADPEGETEQVIAAMWADLLDLPRVGALDDFFELGGHSLLATQVVARMRRAFPGLATPVGVMDLFKYPTVRRLAELVATPEGERAPRRLLHLLTPERREVAASVVCAPYGGGSALIYKPLADAMPADWALHSIAVPGHELGEEAMDIDEVARLCAEEIVANVAGPLVLYGHCGVGVRLTVEIARRVEAAGREIDAVHLGGIFPFARPKGRGAALAERFAELSARLRSDQGMINALAAAGLDVDEVDEEQLRLIVRNRRVGTKGAERYFGELYESEGGTLTAPVIAVCGDRDPATEFYQERFREWHRITGTAAVVVLDEAGHFYLKYRAAELADILTGVHRSISAGEEARHERTDGATWWLAGLSRDSAETAPTPEQVPTPEQEPGRPGKARRRRPVRPTMGRFLTIATGQQLSMIGSALTEFALPIWIYLQSGSLFHLGLLAAFGLVPGIVVAPLAGAIVDRGDRRRVMLWGDVAAGLTQAALLVLYLSDALEIWHAYVTISLLSAALAFQRVAWGSAVPQLVPKRFLGRANGVVQMALGLAQFLVPLIAVGILHVIGLGGILIFDVVSYLLATGVTLAVRFPDAMAATRRESVGAEIRAGFRRALGSRSFRAMLFWFAVLNIFLSPLFLLVTPLVLSFSTTAAAGWVSTAAGLGAVLGGLTLLVWGGPRRMRLRGVLFAALGLAAACVVTGLRPSVTVVAVGAFGMTYGLALLNGIYATVVQTKVPMRFHGRVIAVNTMVAWSTLPIGFALVAPAGPELLQPLMDEGGALASSVGALIGTGEGRGIGLLYLVFGLAMAALVLISFCIPVLARFDHEVPDAESDDLIGLETLQARARSAGPETLQARAKSETNA